MNKTIVLDEFQTSWAKDEIFKELRFLKTSVIPKEKLRAASLVMGLTEMACICKIISMPTFWRLNILTHIYENRYESGSHRNA
jgi:hypothetical protein